MRVCRVFLAVLLLLFGSVTTARAQCVVTAHVGTIANVGANLILNMINVTYWMQTHFLAEHITPTFAQMAEQWTTGDMEVIKQFATHADDEQMHQAMKQIEGMKADFLNQLQASEELCTRVTQGAGFLPTYMKSQSVARELLHTSISTTRSMRGSPAGSGQTDYALARYQHYMNSACAETDLGGAMSGICALTDDNYIDSDIDPEIHFDDLTVVSNDPRSAESQHLNAFIENACGGFVVSMLSGDYFGDENSRDVLLDVDKFWQYAAFCKSSIASYASWKAPGDIALSDQQRATLSEIGYEDDEIDAQYGEFPSLNAQVDVILAAHSNPKQLGPDQMQREEVLLSYDAMGLATELMLWDKYKDIYAQETRNLSLYLGLQLEEQRRVANAGIVSVSNDGKKGL